MMAKGYVSQMTTITQEVLAQGRMDAGTKISFQMMKDGNMDFMTLWNEARKAHGGEEATDEDPKSVKEQIKEAVGSVTSNAKGKPRKIRMGFWQTWNCHAHVQTSTDSWTDCVRTRHSQLRCLVLSS